MTRQRPGILISVGLDLPRLLNRPDVSCQGEIFLDKLPSLARLAVSAGVQKRSYLRRHADHLSREFLLDRAAVRIEPLGLSDVLQQLIGVQRPITKPARTLVRSILLALNAPLEEARRRASLDIILSSPAMPLALDARDGIDDDAIAVECRSLTMAGPRAADEWIGMLEAIWTKTTYAGLDVFEN